MTAALKVESLRIRRILNILWVRYTDLQSWGRLGVLIIRRDDREDKMPTAIRCRFRNVARVLLVEPQAILTNHLRQKGIGDINKYDMFGLAPPLLCAIIFLGNRPLQFISSTLLFIFSPAGLPGSPIVIIHSCPTCHSHKTWKYVCTKTGPTA